MENTVRGLRPSLHQIGNACFFLRTQSLVRGRGVPDPTGRRQLCTRLPRRRVRLPVPSARLSELDAVPPRGKRESARRYLHHASGQHEPDIPAWGSARPTRILGFAPDRSHPKVGAGPTFRRFRSFRMQRTTRWGGRYCGADRSNKSREGALRHCGMPTPHRRKTRCRLPALLNPNGRVSPRLGNQRDGRE